MKEILEIEVGDQVYTLNYRKERFGPYRVVEIIKYEHGITYAVDTPTGIKRYFRSELELIDITITELPRKGFNDLFYALSPKNKA